MDHRITQFPCKKAAKIEHPRPSRAQAEDAVRVLLSYIGEDIEREGLLDTPKRFVKAYEELFKGYTESPKDVLERVFDDVSGYDDMVLLRDIQFFSHCEHHVVPFIGKAHIAYYPREGVVGLSKLARVVDIFARRLQTQEALTQQITDSVMEHLNPRGLALILEGEHMCMSMRGAQKQGVKTITTRFMGAFADDAAEQAKFLALLNRSI